MKIPFVKWLGTAEGYLNVIRLSLFALLVYLVCTTEPARANYHPIVWIDVTLLVMAGILMLKVIYIWIKRPEFKPMLDGSIPATFYQGNIYKYEQHPWYLGFFMVAVSIADFSWNWYVGIVLILYLIATEAVMAAERRKLRALFGEIYRTYARNAGDLFPWHIWKFTKAIFNFNLNDD